MCLRTVRAVAIELLLRGPGHFSVLAAAFGSSSVQWLRWQLSLKILRDDCCFWSGLVIPARGFWGFQVVLPTLEKRLKKQ